MTQSHGSTGVVYPRPCPFCGADLVSADWRDAHLRLGGPTFGMKPCPDAPFLHPLPTCAICGDPLGDEPTVETIDFVGHEACALPLMRAWGLMRSPNGGC